MVKKMYESRYIVVFANTVQWKPYYQGGGGGSEKYILPDYLTVENNGIVARSRDVLL